MINRAQRAASALVRQTRDVIFVLALVLLTFQAVRAQTYRVIHDFTGAVDGGSPYAGLTMDRQGNLYGTTVAGGRGYGTVYKLSYRGSGWVFSPLYSFAGGIDGEGPLSRVVIGPNGTLYGTTYAGGNNCSGGYGCGTVFNLRPSPTFCHTVFCSWTKTVLYRFNGGTDGANPYFGDVIFDQAGNLYDTTEGGGGPECGGTGCGTVFELSPAGGGWTEKLLHTFTGTGGDGANPNGGLVFDQAGNLYGATKGGGPVANGTVFRLSPAGSGWTESILYTFQAPNDGFWPVGGLIVDAAGTLYGTTNSGGVNGGGTAFNMTTAGSETVVFNFSGSLEGGAYDNLVMDAAGNLYGTTYDDGAFDHGAVFKLTPSPGGGWTFTQLYSFTGGSDGRCPYGRVSIDAAGNLYGTTEGGGAHGWGVVWEITP